MATPLNGSLVRGFEILNLISRERPEITTAIVVSELGLNTATAHRFLMTLESVGALVCPKKGTYSLGYKLVDLGQRVLETNRVASVVHPIISSIAEDINESVMAARLVGDKIVCIASAPADRPVSVNIRVGSRLETHSTAHGKLWLAHMDATDLDEFLRSVDRDRQTEATITEEDVLRSELAKIRKEGFSTNVGERERDIGAVAVPIVSKTGDLIVTVSIYGMLSRFDNDLVARARTRLDQAAREITHRLYGAGA